MKRFTLTEKPENLVTFRKTATVQMAVQWEPFIVETQEGDMVISPDTVDDFSLGYYIAYPSDGTKPYAISGRYVEDNYEVV